MRGVLIVVWAVLVPSLAAEQPRLPTDLERLFRRLRSGAAEEMTLSAVPLLSVQQLQHHFDLVDPGAGTEALEDGRLGALMALHDTDGDNMWSYAEFRSAVHAIPDLRVEGSEPQQVHTSFTNSTQAHQLQLVIMWVTGEKTATTTVQYGTSTALGDSAHGSTHTYTEGGWKGVIHEVVLPVLPPSTRIYYRVGDDQAGWSEVFNVVTPPAAGTLQKPHVFAVYGDMGTAIPLGYAVCQQMELDHTRLPFDALLHIGDIAYASTAVSEDVTGDAMGTVGEGGDGEVELIWDIFCRQMQPLAAYIPTVYGVGNHEKFYNYSSYLARFQNPYPWGGSPHEPDSCVFWFSFDYGLVHFTFMSTEHSYDVGSPQREWLEKDLAAAAANRDNVPWIVLTGHRPMYCSDKSELSSHEPGAHFQVEIEPLMAKYGVDLYFCGHMHMYERIHPVLNGTVKQTGHIYNKPGAPVHVVQGTAGVFEDISFEHPAPAWSAIRDGRIGYGRMQVFNASHVFYETLWLQDNKAYDSFWLIR
eukprot:m.134920 g.134920  ORF g.134920 m.134920 type:complete len:528 (+) comp20146_c0_seq3:81-1664(+)